MLFDFDYHIIDEGIYLENIKCENEENAGLFKIVLAKVIEKN